jgi:hypothetical protein
MMKTIQRFLISVWKRIRWAWWSTLPGEISLLGWRGFLDQRRRDREKVARFEAFCQSKGLVKVNGKWEKKR